MDDRLLLTVEKGIWGRDLEDKHLDGDLAIARLAVDVNGVLGAAAFVAIDSAGAGGIARCLFCLVFGPTSSSSSNSVLQSSISKMSISSTIKQTTCTFPTSVACFSYKKSQHIFQTIETCPYTYRFTGTFVSHSGARSFGNRLVIVQRLSKQMLSLQPVA